MATSSTTSVSTGGGLIQSLGIGSGLDVQTLVSKLVAAERGPADARLTRQAQDIASGVSSLGSLKGALSSFQSAVQSLSTNAQFQVMSTSTADNTVFTASATGSAAPGNYSVMVQQLAQPEQLISTAFVGGSSAVVGTGTLALSVNGKSFSVAIDSSHNTLANIRDAINGASGNTGVNATLVYGTTGAQLVLTSAATGASNAITVTPSGGDGGLARLAYSGTPGTNYTEPQKAQDSIVVISGVEHHAATNTVSEAIDGVTLTLNAAKKDTALNLSITPNQNAVISNIQTLVNSYNSMQATFGKLGAYDAASKTAGPLLGDWLLGDTQFRMTRGMTDVVAGLPSAYSSLASIGITTQSDGTLKIDSTKLQAALNADGSSVAALFSGTSGVATRLSATLTTVLSSAGAIAARNQSYTDAQAQLTSQQDKLNSNMAAVQQRYLTQFNALDSLMSQMQTTSNYLTQQLASIATIGATSKSG
jgi:flagellar hook-associated protein 2